MSKGYFEGYYFKHQANGNTIALIPGIANEQAFIQAITNTSSYNYTFPSISFGETIKIGNSSFSTQGITLCEKELYGSVTYSHITPLHSDIMGPFKHFAMECRHGVISMHHELCGNLCINGDFYDFTGGRGYIEKDSGCSFPRQYLWLQCNDFEEKCSIMVSIATIPFMGITFTGCICSIIFKEEEYRIATYKGVRIVLCSKNKLVLAQGKHLLEIDIDGKDSSPLWAPKNGKMSAIIHESNCTQARFRLYCHGKKFFDLYSKNVSFEYNM